MEFFSLSFVNTKLISRKHSFSLSCILEIVWMINLPLLYHISTLKLFDQYINKENIKTLHLFYRYLVRPSPFSAQKTFERHNSRRKSNISFCSQAINLAGSRRNSGVVFPSPRAPPLVTTKANSLSLPDSPTVAGTFRGRSNSLRVVDDILLRRSNSLRQGLVQATRKSSLEEIGIGMHYPVRCVANCVVFFAF